MRNDAFLFTSERTRPIFIRLDTLCLHFDDLKSISRLLEDVDLSDQLFMTKRRLEERNVLLFKQLSSILRPFFDGSSLHLFSLGKQNLRNRLNHVAAVGQKLHIRIVLVGSLVIEFAVIEFGGTRATYFEIGLGEKHG